MIQDRYLLTDSELIIEDEELGIHVRLPFNLPRLPDTIQVDKEKDLFLEKDALGNITAAYCLTSEGIRQGMCRLFYPDGSVKAEMFYDAGNLHGPSIFFCPSQQVLTQTWYIQGKKNGKVKYFYPSGQLASLQRYLEGTCDGLQQYWYENAIVKSLIPYVRGALHGEVRLYWESGAFKRSCHYSHGNREGRDRLWNEEGILIDEGEFKAGQPIGFHRHFFSDGKVREELYHHTPIRFDRKEWDARGNLIIEGLYANDMTYTERVFSESNETQMRKGYWDGQRLCWK